MNIINFFVNLIKDPRTAIASWIAMGVAPTLGFIFLIVFIETGVVFFPFLPGDSLLFAAGFFAAPDAQTGVSALPLFALLPVVWCAPIIGDQCNYWIGHFFGRRIIESGKVKAMTPERIEKTEKMIEKWGPLAVFLGRFFPFIRTFMPFISGISGMRWSRFTPFSVLGGLCWSTLFTLLGYFFGGIPAVQKHFELVIIAILVHKNRNNHQFEMLLHGRNTAEEIAEQREQCGPAQTAEHRERRETAPAHAGNAGNERHERADEREEAAKEHSQRTPLLNHFLGLFDAFRSHGLDFAGFDDATSEEVADPVVALVADDRGAPDHR